MGIKFLFKSYSSKIYLILGISLLVRILFFTSYPLTPIEGDAKGYVNMANNLIAGKGFVFQTSNEVKEGIFYPSIRRAPLYPLIIAFFLKISQMVDCCLKKQLFLKH